VSVVGIFIFGVVITIITIGAVISVGLGEASDPKLSDWDELTGWEKAAVGEPCEQSSDCLGGLSCFNRPGAALTPLVASAGQSRRPRPARFFRTRRGARDRSL